STVALAVPVGAAASLPFRRQNMRRARWNPISRGWALSSSTATEPAASWLLGLPLHLLLGLSAERSVSAAAEGRRLHTVVRPQPRGPGREDEPGCCPAEESNTRGDDRAENKASAKHEAKYAAPETRTGGGGSPFRGSGT